MVARSVTSPVYGVALSSTDMVAVRTSSARSAAPVRWRTPLPPITGSTWPGLRDAVRRLVAEVSPDTRDAAPRLRIALLSPLVEVRAVTIPPVADDDARRLLARAASRHFLDVRDPVVVGVAPSVVREAAPGARIATRLAAAVPLRLLRALHDAVREAGAEVEVVVPAIAAWCRTSTGTVALRVPQPEWQELVVASAGTPVSVRRFRLAGDEAAITEAVGALSMQVMTDPAEAAAAALVAHGSPETSGDRSASWPMAFSLTPEAGTPSAGTTSRTTMLAVAAGALVLAAIGLQEVDVRRELAAIRAERARLASAMGGRGSADATREVAQALDALPDTRWAAALVRITAALPDDAHLTRVQARGDTLMLVGVATRAASAFAALASVPEFARIEATAPVRRETTTDDEVVERFAFAVRLTSVPATGGAR